MPAARSQVARWLRPGTEALGRYVFSLARALRQDPAGADARIIEAARELRDRQALWFDGVGFLGPETVLGLSPGSPAEWLLQGLVARAQVEVRLRTGLERSGHEALACQALAIAAVVPAAWGGPGEARFFLALDGLVEAELSRGGVGAALAAFHQHKDALFAADGRVVGGILGRIAEVLAERRGGEVPEAEDLALLATWLDTHEEMWGNRKTRARVRTALRALYDELAR